MAPTEPDGCTCSPEFIFHDCCNMHDRLYLTSVNRSPAARKKADQVFLACMLHQADGRWFWLGMAWVYYAAVRIFGRYYW